MFELLYLKYSRKQFEKLVFIRHFHFFFVSSSSRARKRLEPCHCRGHLILNSEMDTMIPIHIFSCAWATPSTVVMMMRGQKKKVVVMPSPSEPRQASHSNVAIEVTHYIILFFMRHSSSSNLALAFIQ